MVRSIAAALLCACMPVYADTVTVVAAGTMNDYSDPDHLLPFSRPAEGTSFVLRFAYDAEAPDTSADVKVGDFRDAISTMSISIGSNTFQSPLGNRILIINDNGNSSVGYSDLWIANTINDAPLCACFGLTLINFDGTALASDALVAPSWPFPPWGYGSIDYAIEDRSILDSTKWKQLAWARANVTSVTVVPGPPAVWLLSTALGLLGWTSRKSTA